MNKGSLIGTAARRLRRGFVLAGVAGVFALAGISAASAQSTTGSVFGKAPTGYSVSVRSTTTGAGRTVRVDHDGRYSARELPVGTYTVTLKEGSQAVAEHLNVSVVVGRGMQVDFDCAELKLACANAVAAK